ncbi:Uncharacterized protein APZ42_033816 [Daphnia magna]|uniref:Uncharacterized protein n=1 Tax=Daphnia magna TaxID=35525 RepID=A0A164KQ41_9CRUS|nr:Uncharacterized protein APZ42_033816 [Daphnia magna]
MLAKDILRTSVFSPGCLLDYRISLGCLKDYPLLCGLSCICTVNHFTFSPPVSFPMCKIHFTSCSSN